MKIAILADRLVMGGLETHIISTVNELLKRGHRILLNPAYLNPELLPRFHQDHPSFHHRLWSDSFREDLEWFQPDLIHAHPFTAIFRGYEAARHFQKPLIVTMHGLYDFGLDRSDMGNRVSDLVQAIIAVDPRVASILAASTAHPEKIKIIYNGIDLDEYRPLPLKKAMLYLDVDWNPNWKTVVIVSRLADGKERPVYQVMDCLSSLVNRLNGLNAYIVGDGSWYDDIYSKAEAVKKINDQLNLKLVGRQNDVRPFLAMADLVLACDRAAVEAMASGRTVFGMNAQGFAGVIEPANLSEIILYRRGFRSFSDAELQQELIDLLLNNRKRYYYSCRGVELVDQYFDIAKVTTELEEVYRSAVEKQV